MNAVFAGCAMLIVFPLENVVHTRNPAPTNMSGWHEGGSTRVRLTVITMDFERLLCASDKSFGEEHCAYKDENTLWPLEPGQPLDDVVLQRFHRDQRNQPDQRPDPRRWPRFG